MASNRSRFRCPGAFWIAGALMIAPLSAAVHAQETVHGSVFDSLAERPLPGATVNLVSSAAQTAAMVATSDSLGRFTFARLPRGDYIAGFFHPLLDSLGIEAPLRRVRIESSDVSLTLAIPSRRTLRQTICGRAADDDSTAVLVGEIRDAATRAALVGATVSASWLRFSMDNGRVLPRTISPAVATDGNGRFAICGVPSAIDVQVQTVLGADSSGAFAMAMHPGEIARRILYLGRSTARLHGRVRDAHTSLPLANAHISVVGSAAAAASNDSGAFEIPHAPTGTHTLEAHAIGYLAQLQVVDVLPDRDPTRDFTLEKTRNVIDTIRIRAERLDQTGFAERRHSGAGKFFDANDIAHMRPHSTSQLMDFAPQVRRFGDKIMAKGLLTQPFCNPSVFVDGFLYIDGRREDVTTRDIDMLVWPEDIAGLEIYRASDTPPQFQLITNGSDPWCGAIVIWRRARPKQKREGDSSSTKTFPLNN